MGGRFALAAIVASILSSSPAFALNTLALAAEPTGAVGQLIPVTLTMSFDDVTVGGAIAVDSDLAILRLASVTFSSALGDDPDFRCPTDPSAANPVTCPADSEFISFGTVSGLQGDMLVATLLFEAIGVSVGETTIAIMLARDFSDPVGSPLDVTFGSAGLVITPEPTSLVLLGFGLSLISARRR